MRAHMPIPSRVLVIDDDEGVRVALTVALEDEFQVYTAATGAEGLALLHKDLIPVVLLDIRLPGMDGLEVLRQIKTLDPHIAVLMLTAWPEVPVVVAAMQGGAVDFLPKPWDVAVLRTRLCQAFAYVRQQRPAPLGTPTQHRALADGVVIGRSAAMRQLWHVLQRVADTTATVLLIGESGTGKEHLARALHQSSPRRTGPFVALDCAAIPDSLVDSVLFGHERGAFTGAERQHIGVFEQAHTGTLFLDEISNLSMTMQAALLRVLQERAVQRVGSEETRHVDVRLVAATHQDLRQLVSARLFRQDLFYRLYVIPLTVPPLRACRTDIPLLVTHFLAKYNTAYGRDIQGATVAALEVLRQYHWPGNVRELEHCLARLVVLSNQPLLDAAEVRAALGLSEAHPEAPPVAHPGDQ